MKGNTSCVSCHPGVCAGLISILNRGFLFYYVDGCNYYTVKYIFTPKSPQVSSDVERAELFLRGVKRSMQNIRFRRGAGHSGKVVKCFMFMGYISGFQRH